MKILVLGGNGMLGHQLTRSWGRTHEVHATFRSGAAESPPPAGGLAVAGHYEVDSHNTAVLRTLVRHLRPEAVVNAIGVVKQREQASDAVVSIKTNALLPHQLADICSEVGARLVQVSTDCVFSGRKGMYSERDTPDADDLYGRSKLLGEVFAPNAITLRTSIIGLELSNKHSLIEWFLAQRGSIKGYRKAIYSGFTTIEMARIIERILVARPWKNGLYHASSDPIDKFGLLTKLRDLVGRNVELIPDDTFVCDRSLDSSKFRTEFAYVPPSWDAMLGELSTQIKERDR